MKSWPVKICLGVFLFKTPNTLIGENLVIGKFVILLNIDVCLF